jgi:hypothetical protein
MQLPQSNRHRQNIGISCRGTLLRGYRSGSEPGREFAGMSEAKALLEFAELRSSWPCPLPPRQ